MNVPIVLELGSSLRELASAHELTLQTGLEYELGLLLDQLGLPGNPLVEVQSTEALQALRVRVHGIYQNYAPRLMGNLWHTLAPADFRMLPWEKVSYQAGFPDDWFQSYVQNCAATELQEVSEYLIKVTLAVIREQPACLLGQAQTERYLALADANLPVALPVEATCKILKALLNLGVTIKERTKILWLISNSLAKGCSEEDIVEAAFAQLHPVQIEILADPEYLHKLLNDVPIDQRLSVLAEQIEDRFQEPFRLLADGLFYELGIQVPEIVWLPSTELAPGTFVIKLNDGRQTLFVGLQPGETFVNSTVEQLSARNKKSRPAPHPVDDSSAAIVTDGNTDDLTSAGFSTWTAPAYIVLAAASEIRRHADQLIDRDVVEYMLAQLDLIYPELTWAALAQFSLEDITRVLRGLLREGLSVRNLRAILEQLLQYDSIHVDTTRIVFDERLSLSESDFSSTVNHWRNYREFVRSGMKAYISHKFTRGRGTLPVYLIDPDLEARLETTNGSGLDESETDTLRQALWREVNSTPPGEKPAVLTIPTVRAILHDLIAVEFADLPILAYSELSPDLNIQPLSRISLS